MINANINSTIFAATVYCEDILSCYFINIAFEFNTHVPRNEYPCTHKCYHYNEEAKGIEAYKCKNDCECGSTRYCKFILSDESDGWCQGLNTFYENPLCNAVSEITVICKRDNSCDNLWLDIHENIYLNIFMLKYSSNVHIGYRKLEDINFVCGNRWDTYSDCYDTMYLQNKTYIHDWHRDRYNNHHLPCEGVKIHYQNNSGDYQCEVRYELSTRNNVGKDWLLCFSLNVNIDDSRSPYALYCPFETNTEALQEYTFSWLFDIVIDTFEFCDEYFGNENKTDHTLIVIDNIIHRSILSCMVNEMFVYASPKSSLVESVLFDKNTPQFVSISTLFVIKYHQNKYLQMSDTFNENSACYDNTMRLLGAYFSTIVKEHHYYKYLYFLVFIPILITAWLIYKFYKYKTSFIVNKALVWIIAIRQFDDPDYNLDGVAKDVQRLAKLWNNIYQYKVIICNEDNLYCTKQNITDFIDKHKKNLEKFSYNGIIVHVISHGTENGMMKTSDMKNLNIIEFLMHEINQCCTNQKIIKLLIYHCCRGQEVYHTLPPNNNTTSIKTRGFPLSNDRKPQSSSESNCAVIYGTIKGRAISDKGYFAECIYESFAHNISKRCRIFRKPFNQLFMEIGIALEKKTREAEICSDDGIITLRFNKIYFEKCRKRNKSD
eukprot:72218_1